MSNITLTIPNDDHIALRAFGKALEEMALAHGAEPRKTVGELSYKLNIDTSAATAALERLNAATGELMQAAPQMMGEAEIDTTAQQVESLAAPMVDDEEQTPPTTDSTGTPWDERIHSASKALNADGTWRLRRKPKDMDEEQWVAFVETVKLELNHGEEIREAMDKAERGEAVYYTSEEAEQKMDEFKESVRQSIEPPVTPPGDDFHTDADVVTEQTVVGIPPLPVPPPVVVAPPVPEVVEWDFPRLMTFLTERHGKIDVATVNTLLAQDGMSSVQELNAHPDKIGPFVARVKAHLGE
ncbi:hypothetical protein H391_gp49 [Klebsiella phage JD001]|uniref:Uncharacterized protein n=1 Tax=Klebsiella phage JD001 TaxID=1236000 RepID=L0AQQ9_9CAUD|nr:hypothetical protein H391_gp49 [Klebsiella phage JD001]AFZ77603.1 hypothetical protein [Klebsiella phage JD001]